MKQFWRRVALPQALNLTGPSVAMTAPHVPADASGAPQDVTFQVALSGASTLPVRVGVELSVLDPNPSPAAPDPGSPLAFAAPDAQLLWAPGEAGPRNFTVRITGGGRALAAGALVARLVNASNADVDAQRSAAAATARPARDLVTAFALVPNQARPWGQETRDLTMRFACLLCSAS